MRINEFFAKRLNAPFHNPVNSWGALDSADRIFLRVDEGYYDQGKGRVMIYDPEWRPSPGHRERLTHIDAIRHGAVGFAVLVKHNESGHIDSYNEQTLIVLGCGNEVFDERGLTYVRVRGKIAVEKIVAEEDADSIRANKKEFHTPRLKSTRRKALIDARLGQGLFRRTVLGLWDYQCAVTGIAVPDVIRAGHIKPWSNSSDAERLDPFNGLPMVATLDALFDAGLVSFDAQGKMILSRRILEAEQELLGIRRLRLRQRPSRRTLSYLAYHRRHRFLR